MNAPADTGSIFVKDWTVENINQLHENTLCSLLGMRFTERGADFLRASMPVDRRTVQPVGILHGGASLALVETMGSVAAWMCLADGWNAVGLDINANHIRAVTRGEVHARATPAHIGRTTHVWLIDVRDDDDKLVCTARMTIAIVQSRRDPKF